MPENGDSGSGHRSIGVDSARGASPTSTGRDSGRCEAGVADDTKRGSHVGGAQSSGGGAAPRSTKMQERLAVPSHTCGWRTDAPCDGTAGTPAG